MPQSLAAKVRAAQFSDERKSVTLMFVDLVNSTGLAEQFDPEEWRDIVARALDRFAAVIYRYEGTVTQLLGDGILAFFGAPVAHEDDPVRAVLAALGVVEASRELSAETQRAHGIDLAVRLGVNTGLVVVGLVGADLHYEYSPTGDAVNMAARLQSAARPMTVLVSESTYRLVASSFNCTPLGLIELKGKSQAVPVYEVISLTSARVSRRGVSLLRSPVVGRSEELATFHSFLLGLQSGRGSAALVVGDPGAGKSRLLEEAMRVSESLLPNARWEVGQCLSFGWAAPYHAVTDLLRSMMGTPIDATEAMRRTALADLAADLAPDDALAVRTYLGHLLRLRLPTEASERILEASPESLRANYRTALRALVLGLSKRAPLGVVVEDVHWADASSVELLGSLIPLTQLAPVLLCFTTRPDPGAISWRLADIARRAGGEFAQLEISVLGEADSLEVVGGLLGVLEPPPGLERLLSRAEGNPFFIGELVAALIEEGTLENEHGDWRLREESQKEIPQSLQGLLRSRIDGLASEPKRILRVASVIGRQFTTPVLGAVLAVSDNALSKELDGLQSAGLLAPGDPADRSEYVFSHALLQEAAYESLLKKDRIHIHRGVGEALETLHPDLVDELSPTLARHFEQGQVPAKAVRYFLNAAERARLTFANTEAEQLYRSGLALLEAVPEDSEVLVAFQEGLGDVLDHATRCDEARACYENALGLERALPPVHRATLHRKIGSTEQRRHRYDDALAALAEAEEALGPWPSDEDLPWIRTWLDVQAERIYVHYWRGDLEIMDELIGQIRGPIERYGTLDQRHYYFRSLTLADFRRTVYCPTEETFEYARACLEAARKVGPWDEGMALFLLGFAGLHAGDLDIAGEYLNLASASANRLGDNVLASRCWIYLALLSRKRGNVAETQAMVERAEPVADSAGMDEYLVQAKAHRAWLAWRNGDLDEADRLARAAVAALRELPIPYPIEWIALWPMIGVAIERERTHEAIAAAIELLAPNQQRQPAPIRALLEQAVSEWQASRPAEAKAQLDEAVVLARQLEYL